MVYLLIVIGAMIIFGAGALFGYEYPFYSEDSGAKGMISFVLLIAGILFEIYLFNH